MTMTPVAVTSVDAFKKSKSSQKTAAAMTMARRTRARSSLLILLATTCQLHSVDAYASWLKCYVELDPEEVIMNRQVLSDTDASHAGVHVVVKSAQDDEWVENYTYSANKLTSLLIKLHVPSELQEENVQFVVETSDGAKFTSPEMCDGKRSFSRAHDDAVELVIEGTSPSISLKAGWAPGFEAVSLTPLLTLTREGEATTAEEL